MSLPFDASQYTAEELASARIVVHQFYRKGQDRRPPQGPFDPSLYNGDELGLIRDAVQALRQGVTAGGPVSAQLRFGPQGCAARLVRGVRGGSADEPVPLSDWFACPDTGFGPAPQPRTASYDFPNGAQIARCRGHDPLGHVTTVTYSPHQLQQLSQPTTYTYSTYEAPPRPKPALYIVRVTEEVRTEFFDGQQVTHRQVVKLRTTEKEYQLDEATGNYRLVRTETRDHEPPAPPRIEGMPPDGPHQV